MLLIRILQAGIVSLTLLTASSQGQSGNLFNINIDEATSLANSAISKQYPQVNTRKLKPQKIEIETEHYTDGNTKKLLVISMAGDAIEKENSMEELTTYIVTLSPSGIVEDFVTKTSLSSRDPVDQENMNRRCVKADKLLSLRLNTAEDCNFFKHGCDGIGSKVVLAWCKGTSYGKCFESKTWLASHDILGTGRNVKIHKLNRDPKTNTLCGLYTFKDTPVNEQRTMNKDVALVVRNFNLDCTIEQAIQNAQDAVKKKYPEHYQTLLRRGFSSYSSQSRTLNGVTIKQGTLSSTFKYWQKDPEPAKRSIFAMPQSDNHNSDKKGIIVVLDHKCQAERVHYYER